MSELKNIYAIPAINQLIEQYETSTQLHLTDKRIAYRNFLIIFSFISGISLKNAGSDFPLVLACLALLGIVLFGIIKAIIDKIDRLILEPWISEKCKFIDRHINDLSKFRDFRLNNSNYNCYLDINVYLVKQVPRRLNWDQLFEVNREIERMFPNLKSQLINTDFDHSSINDYSINDDDSSFDDDSSIDDDATTSKIEDVIINNIDKPAVIKEEKFELLNISSTAAKALLSLTKKYLTYSISS